MKSQSKLAITAIVGSISASLCCITPILAITSSVTGIATTFSWLEPYRPFLVGITVLILSYAWYKKIQKPKNTDIHCDCDEPESMSFMQTKKFLVGVSLFSLITLTFPYYSHAIIPSSNKDVVIVEKSNIATITFIVVGMTCGGCEAHVENEVEKLKGILKVDANYSTGLVEVKYDKSKVSIEAIQKAINNTGYKSSIKETEK